ncbi:MAG: phosphoglycerate kinase [Candidatus Omnitrophica bacterium]|nr:phosphoglycerate kinase [Candidatus Omnitrophota bacterium]
MAKLSLRDLDWKQKIVLVRVDFNVPLDENLKITDDTRIRATLPTIKYLLEQGTKKVILISHLGRPDGKRVEKYSLKPVAERLRELLKEEIEFLDDCIGEKIKSKINSTNRRVILLENLRFHPEEEQNDPKFSQELASLAEVFVNDAFGTSHRAHASTEGVTHYLKSVAGFLLEKEIKYLGEALENPKRPFVVILGGAKVSDKIGVFDNLLPKADTILVGGAMAYTFLKAEGFSIGNSKLEKDKIELAKSILEKAKKLKKELILPCDHIIVEEISSEAKIEITKDQNIPEAKIAVDIGPKTIEVFKEKLKSAKTVAWNGPLGIFEIDKFSQGTAEIAKFISSLKDAITIVGGGDTASAVAKFKLEEKFTHVSTGGGASLEFMEGKTLPGIASLTDK